MLDSICYHRPLLIQCLWWFFRSSNRSLRDLLETLLPIQLGHGLGLGLGLCELTWGIDLLLQLVSWKLHQIAFNCLDPAVGVVLLLHNLTNNFLQLSGADHIRYHRKIFLLLAQGVGCVDLVYQVGNGIVGVWDHRHVNISLEGLDAQILTFEGPFDSSS